MHKPLLAAWAGLGTLFAVSLAAAPAHAEPRHAIFSVKIVTEIARSVAGLAGPHGEHRKEMLDEAQRRLHAAYPELITGPEEGLWVFNSVGGSLEEIKLLFCSPSEYMALWGAPVDTNGFSGRYWGMDVWDIMLDGKMVSYAPGGDHQTTTFANGGGDASTGGVQQTSLLERGIGKHFTLQQGGYMIDYGRGDLVSSLIPGAILGHTYVTGDSYSLKHILGACAKQTFANWLTPERRRAIAHYRETNPDYSETVGPN